MSDQEAYALGGDGLLVGAWSPHRPCGNEDAHLGHSFMAVDPVINEERAFLCGGKSVPALPVRPMVGEEVLRSVYRERAALTALLAACYPSTLGHTDPQEPDWAVLIVNMPSGQAAWHISPDDMDLFGHVDRTDVDLWDGHTTAQKYERIAAEVRALTPGAD